MPPIPVRATPSTLSESPSITRVPALVGTDRAQFTFATGEMSGVFGDNRGRLLDDACAISGEVLGHSDG
jgi:hypothetical protein